MNFFRKRYLAFREIINWFFIRKVIKQNKNTEQWKKFKLRSGYINQIYTVINLKKEYLGEPEIIQRTRLLEMIKPINEYIESLGLSEIVYPELRRIPNSQSWLIIYWPLWRYFSIWRLIFYLILLFIGYKIWVYFELSKIIF